MQSNPHSSRFNYADLSKSSTRNQKATWVKQGQALLRENSNSKSHWIRMKFFTSVPRTADKKWKFYAA